MRLVPVCTSLALALLAACSRSDDSKVASRPPVAGPSTTTTATTGAASAKHFKIAVVPKGTSHEFWKAVEAGARKADSELDDLEIVWKGPPGEGDAAAQIALVESFIADRYDGICLAPLDGQALETPVKTAIANGIPVVIFDSALADHNIPVVSFVATDNFHGGQVAGEELTRLLQGRGNVVLMRYQVGSLSTDQREQGFLEAVTRSINMNVISYDRHGGPDEAKAIEVGENLLATYGPKIDGMFCSNESCTSGMITALRRDPRQLAGKIKLVGFDSSTNIVDAMKEGVLYGTVLQDPVQMGYLAVTAMHDKLVGKPVKARIETGETLATKDNMESERVHALLFPLGSR